MVDLSSSLCKRYQRVIAMLPYVTGNSMETCHFQRVLMSLTRQAVRWSPPGRHDLVRPSFPRCLPQRFAKLQRPQMKGRTEKCPQNISESLAEIVSMKISQRSEYSFPMFSLCDRTKMTWRKALAPSRATVAMAYGALVPRPKGCLSQRRARKLRSQTLPRLLGKRWSPGACDRPSLRGSLRDEFLHTAKFIVLLDLR